MGLYRNNFQHVFPLTPTSERVIEWEQWAPTFNNAISISGNRKNAIYVPGIAGVEFLGNPDDIGCQITMFYRPTGDANLSGLLLSNSVVFEGSPYSKLSISDKSSKQAINLETTEGARDIFVGDDFGLIAAGLGSVFAEKNNQQICKS